MNMAKIDIPFETLVTDLHGSDWTKRCDAARMLGQSRDPHAVDVLLPDLQDSDWRVRRNAAQALGALKSPRAISGLLDALKDRTATVRERAAVALGRIKDPETIPALVKAVIEEKDSSFHVNEGAYQAVRKFGRKAGPHLVEELKVKQNIYLVELLADSNYEAQTDFFITLAQSEKPAMRRTAINALAKSEDPQAVDFLIRLLSSKDIDTQILAVQSLAKLHAVQSTPRLLDLLDENQLYGPRAGLYREISDAFQELSGIKKDIANAFPFVSTLSFGVGGVATSLAEMMGRLGNDGFQKLNQLLNDAENRADELKAKSNLPPEIFQSFSDQTWKFGAMFADARDAKTEQIRMLMGWLKSDVPLTRAAAALSLPWYMDGRVLEALERAIQDEEEIVRCAAAWAHGALKNSVM